MESIKFSFQTLTEHETDYLIYVGNDQRGLKSMKVFAEIRYSTCIGKSNPIIHLSTVAPAWTQLDSSTMHPAHKQSNYPS